jgi:CubicO group peptidase (beta-lactamase class C family)
MPRPIVGLLLLLVPLPAVAQAPPLAEVVDRAATAELDRQKLVGLAVGVIVDGDIRYLKGYGRADREAGIDVNPNETLFRWASCSKPVTAIAALQLAEAGRLDLDADVRRYVPEFPDKGVTITSRQLLCHQGGIVHYLTGKVVRTQKTYDVEHPFTDVICALDTFKDSPLVCQPGEKYSYTTHGYILLSAVVQRAGRKPFADQVTERIAGPLEMAGFQPDFQWKALPNRAAGYVKRGEALRRRPKYWDPDVSWKLGGGGYTSTVEDFAKFAAGLVNRKLVNSKTEAEMWRRQKLADGQETTYGLGFGLGTTPGGVNWVGHSGSQEKTRTAMLLEPQSRKGVVVMTNSEWANPTAVAAAVLDAIAGKSPGATKSGKSGPGDRE